MKPPAMKMPLANGAKARRHNAGEAKGWQQDADGALWNAVQWQSGNGSGRVPRYERCQFCNECGPVVGNAMNRWDCADN